jgi:hypothetical protein
MKLLRIPSLVLLCAPALLLAQASAPSLKSILVRDGMETRRARPPDTR